MIGDAVQANATEPLGWRISTAIATSALVFLLLRPLAEVPSMEGLTSGFVAIQFDVVPVRTNDESCIVIRVVARAQTRRTIVFATRLQSRAIEGFDLLAILGRERQVKMRGLLLGLEQAQ